MFVSAPQKLIIRAIRALKAPFEIIIIKSFAKQKNNNNNNKNKEQLPVPG